MGKIVIKRRVSLDFLGEDYVDSFVMVRAMSLNEYDNLKDKDKDKTVRDVVTEHFVSGSIKQGKEFVDITSENLNELPGDVFTKIWNVLVGVTDPKVETP